MAEAQIVRENAPVYVDLATGGQAALGPKAIDADLYDTEFLGATGAQNIRFFVSRTWGTGPLITTQKTQVDTNMQADGTMLTPKTHYMMGLIIVLLPNLTTNARITEADFINFKANTWVSFYQGKRKMFERNCEQLTGLGFNALQNNASAMRNLQFNSVDPGLYFHYGKAYANGPNQSFRYELSSTADLNLSATVRVKLLTPGWLDTVVG